MTGYDNSGWQTAGSTMEGGVVHHLPSGVKIDHRFSLRFIQGTPKLMTGIVLIFTLFMNGMGVFGIVVARDTIFPQSFSVESAQNIALVALILAVWAGANYLLYRAVTGKTLIDITSDGIFFMEANRPTVKIRSVPRENITAIYCKKEISDDDDGSYPSVLYSIVVAEKNGESVLFDRFESGVAAVHYGTMISERLGLGQDHVPLFEGK